MAKQHLIDKANIKNGEWVDVADTPLPDGEARLAVKTFALTANNVSYATLGGPPMHYWQFFPATADASGRVPVWGFADVIASHHDGLKVGQRFYGFYPMSETLDVIPSRISESGFVDARPHRAHLAPVYNSYTAVDADPTYHPSLEAQQMLFRPLYLTGWLIVDCVLQGDPVPETLLISSASSKTALAVAHSAKARGLRRVGLTSPRNIAFVRESGLYDDVLSYDELDAYTPEGTVTYVDFTGRPDLTLKAHTRAGEKLLNSMIIGLTDWEADRAGRLDMPGPKPEIFFVPSYIAERTKGVSASEIMREMMTDLAQFYPISKSFVTPKYVEGEDAIAQAWRDSVDGAVAPSEGLICKF